MSTAHGPEEEEEVLSEEDCDESRSKCLCLFVCCCGLAVGGIAIIIV